MRVRVCVFISFILPTIQRVFSSSRPKFFHQKWTENILRHIGRRRSFDRLVPRQQPKTTMNQSKQSINDRAFMYSVVDSIQWDDVISDSDWTDKVSNGCVNDREVDGMAWMNRSKILASTSMNICPIYYIRFEVLYMPSHASSFQIDFGLRKREKENRNAFHSTAVSIKSKTEK